MMLPKSRIRLTGLARYYSTQPPPARPFKAHPKPSAQEPAPAVENPVSPAPAASSKEPLDPERGRAASLRYIQEGVLDPKYKRSSRQVISIICAIPVLVVTSWVLYQRQFMGVERRRAVKSGGENGDEKGNDQVVAVMNEG